MEIVSDGEKGGFGTAFFVIVSTDEFIVDVGGELLELLTGEPGEFLAGVCAGVLGLLGGVSDEIRTNVGLCAYPSTCDPAASA